MKLEFRRIAKDELKQLWYLHRDYVDRKSRFKDIKKIYFKLPNLFVGCFNRNNLIGYIFLDNLKRDYFIEGMAVKHKYWRKGIGSKLLRRIETQARQERIKKITVGVAPIGWVERFYMKNGYKPYLFLVRTKKKKIYIKVHKYNSNQKEKVKEKLNASEVLYIMKKDITKKKEKNKK